MGSSSDSSSCVYEPLWNICVRMCYLKGILVFTYDALDYLLIDVLSLWGGDGGVVGRWLCTILNTFFLNVFGFASGSMSNLENGKADGIPNPKHVLFQPEKIRLEWQKCHRIGVGLINMGNTCFLNSTLQCLSYTPPLANYLLSHQHKEQCKWMSRC